MPSNYDGSPPPVSQSRTLIVRVNTTQTQEFLVLSRVPYGQWIHWWGRRSHECVKDKAFCQKCADSWPDKWKGYLHCLTDCGRTECFLELTKTAIEAIEAKMIDGQGWRGMRVRISRTSGGAKGRYLIDLLEARADPEKIPQPRDPVDVLRYLWNAKKTPVQTA